MTRAMQRNNHLEHTSYSLLDPGNHHHFPKKGRVKSLSDIDNGVI